MVNLEYSVAVMTVWGTAKLWIENETEVAFPFDSKFVGFKNILIPLSTSCPSRTWRQNITFKVTAAKEVEPLKIAEMKIWYVRPA